jgi:hypothetical protein
MAGQAIIQYRRRPETGASGVQPSLEKTLKQRIIEMLQRLPDDIDFDRAIEGIYVLRCVEEAREQVRRGEVYDHDEVFHDLLATDEIQAEVGARGKV